MNRNFLRLYALTKLNTPKEIILKLREELEDEDYFILTDRIFTSTGGVIEVPSKLEEIIHLCFAKAAIEKEKEELEYSPDWEAMYAKLKELFFYEGTQPLDPVALVEIKDILKAEKDTILSKVTMEGKAFKNDEIIEAKKKLFEKVESFKALAIDKSIKELSKDYASLTEEVRQFISEHYDEKQTFKFSEASDEDKEIFNRLEKNIMQAIQDTCAEQEGDDLKVGLIKQINIITKKTVDSELHRRKVINPMPIDSMESYNAKALVIVLLLQKSWVFIDKYFDLKKYGFPSLEFLVLLMNLISGSEDLQNEGSNPYVHTTIDIHGITKEYEIQYLRRKLYQLGVKNMDKEMEKDNVFSDIAFLERILKIHPATNIRLDATNYKPKKSGNKKDTQLGQKLSSLAGELKEVNAELFNIKELKTDFSACKVYIDQYLNGSLVDYDINKHYQKKRYVYQVYSLIKETGLDDIDEYADIFGLIKEEMKRYKRQKSRTT